MLETAGQFAERMQPERNSAWTRADEKQFERTGLAREKSPHVLEKRKRFFRRAKEKLFVLASAGLVTLSGVWQDVALAADQLRAKRVGTDVEFRVEREMSFEKLNDLEARLAKEEPEFMEWMKKYITDFDLELDKVYQAVSQFDEEKEAREKQEMFSGLPHLFPPEPIKALIDTNHKFLLFLRDNTQVLDNYNKYIARNLKYIILYNIYRNDYPEIRQRLISTRAPSIEFFYHNKMGFSSVGLARPISETDPVNTVITLTLGTFNNGVGQLDMNRYVDVVTHELNHSLNFGAYSAKELEEISYIRYILREGIAQEYTLEILKLMQQEKGDIRVDLGSEYDQRVILISIIDALLKSSGREDLLSKWNSGLVSDDDFLAGFKSSLNELSLDPQIADELLNFSGLGEPPVFSSLISILARLKIDGVDVSPQLLKSMITRGMIVDAKEISDLEGALNLKGIASRVSSRERDIRETAGGSSTLKKK